MFKKKEQLVNKETEQSSNETETKKAILASEITSIAYGIFKDKNSGEWMVAKIGYNAETNTVGEIVKLPAGPSKDFAIELMRIEVGSNLF